MTTKTELQRILKGIVHMEEDEKTHKFERLEKNKLNTQKSVDFYTQ
jgi:hypothetical protein